MTTSTTLTVSLVKLTCLASDNVPDVLASFNAPKLDSITSKQSQVSSPQTTRATFPSTASTSAPIPSETEETDEDFEDSLVEGMESLLRQLASDHPPGPMPDAETSKPTGQPLVPGLERTEGEASLSAEEEEQAWQKALEMMLSGEALEALGLDKNGVGDQSRAAVVPQGGEAKPDFQETIRRTMESLNQPATSGARRATGAGDGAPPNLAALLSQLGSDPSALDGLGGDDGELGGLLDGMMAQLMTREVLEEPMSELASKVRSIPPAENS